MFKDSSSSSEREDDAGHFEYEIGMIIANKY